jgi:hypothetical protein
MHIIYIVLIFCLVLFLYLHVYFQLKTSNDLEIYEIDNPSKDKLEEICDLRQPVLFQFQNERIFESCRRANILDTYGAFDIKIRNVKQSAADDEDNLYVPLAFSNALNVLREDSAHKYLIENNSDFLEETGIIKSYRYNDVFLRPYMVAQCNYDLLLAADQTRTPFRYELNYRNYLLVTEGEIKVKLAPPKSSKYLYQQKDYENLEFSSPLNPWQIQPHYKADFDKIKCLDLTLKRGQILYIPAYWWYSIEFGKETSVATFKYKTYMNAVAILPQLVIKLLQTQNVKRNNMAVAKGSALSNPQPTASGCAVNSLTDVISNQNGLVEPTIAEPTENATSLADMISPQSGIAYPTASGIAYPTASGIAYPTASGIAYPTASGIATLISSEL